MKSKRYANRKARMAKDPEYRRKVLRAQADSRARATQARWEKLVAEGQACRHEYPNGRHCWKSYAHTHGGEPVINQTS